MPKSALEASRASQLSVLLKGNATQQAAVRARQDDFIDGLPGLVVGSLLMVLGLVTTWHNEERSARLWALHCAVADVVSVDAKHIDPNNRGRLVHAQGFAAAKAPISDRRFKGSMVQNCLKLQGTVEVFEWVQSTQVCQEGSSGNSPRFHTEWSLMHHDSSRFKKPSPDNPLILSEVRLGTLTSACDEVFLGNFLLPEDMVRQFNRFETIPVGRLPGTLEAFGLTFAYNIQDGYYYARPSGAGDRRHDMFVNFQAGDLRVRFLWVPDSNATAVAVQCNKDGADSFVPFRVVPRSLCCTEQQAREKIIEEGQRTLRDLLRANSAGGGGCSVGLACCCPCSTVSRICTQEVVTEEVYHISDQLDSCEKPFEEMVGRNAWKVSTYRCLGLAVSYLGFNLALPSLWSRVASGFLAVFGGVALQVFSAMFLVVTWTMVTAAAYAPYAPRVSLGLSCLAALTVILFVCLAMRA